MKSLSAEASMLVMAPLAAGSQLNVLLTSPTAVLLLGFRSLLMIWRAVPGFPQLGHWSTKRVVENAGVDTPIMNGIMRTK
ncbi:MAG: hypothetical protein DMD79_11315 [Candidatus Rokuibacteriota bacterium]|nr:MAG: hypothetical protein DMD79_11315 [Candidatus Rokubacteria bacterium]